MKKVGILVLLVALTVLAPLQAARGDKKTREDPDDSAGGLDIESLLHRHEGEGNRALLVHKLATYEAWETDELEDLGTDIVFTFWVHDEIKRYILVDTSPDGTPYAEITDWDTGKIVGYARVWRPDEKALKIEFPQRALGKDIKRYQWSASTSWHQDGHAECGEDEHGLTSCIDHAPDEGQISHVLK